jgi:hypothetical protein
VANGTSSAGAGSWAATGDATANLGGSSVMTVTAVAVRTTWLGRCSRHAGSSAYPEPDGNVLPRPG